MKNIKNIKNKNNICLILAIILITVMLGIFQYMTGITLNPLYNEGYAALSMYMFAIGAAILVYFSVADFKGAVQSKVTNIKIIKDKKDEYKYIITIILMASPIIISIIFGFITSPLFMCNKYKNQIGKIEEKDFKTEFENLDLNKVPVVDQLLAEKLADKKLGEKQSLGSQVITGEPVIQIYNEKLVWVVPLEHSGFFKWLDNIDGTPGYIIVSATDQRDVEFVGNHKIKYQPNSYFNTDIRRKARYSKSYMQGMVDYSFELNEEGVPFWVITTYKNTKFLGLPEVSGIIALNATTGDMKEYKLKDIPAWVDRAQPEEYIIAQLQNSGEYVKGVFNFSNYGKYRVSQKGNIIYNGNTCYLFTGLTSIGSDESITGFVSVDMKTKKVSRYNVGGATEYAASMSAEGKVQNLGYKSSSPVIVNVDTVPTYFMTLKDKEGLIKQYAFVSVKDYTTVVAADTVELALKAYKKSIGETGQVADENKTETLTAITLKVKRIASERVKDELVYKIMLEDSAVTAEDMKDKIYIAKAALSEELALTNVGDMVEIKVYKTNTKISMVEEIDNKEI
ncbi:MAG: hypothetical protein RR751_06555 [Clostridia bacterium]